MRTCLYCNASDALSYMKVTGIGEFFSQDKEAEAKSFGASRYLTLEQAKAEAVRGGGCMDGPNNAGTIGRA
jgi:hypothetical protein